MPFKMLIVDDEPIICRGLQQTIPWDEYMVEVVDLAYDGAEAIQKIKEHGGIDLVLTDVRMPNVDGLRLAAFLAENYPDIRTIIISGYDDFKYAQQAIQLGVKDYLLKPVDVDELLRVITKIISTLQEERKSAQQIYQMNLQNAIFHLVLDLPDTTPNHSSLFADVRIYPFVTMLKDYKNKTKDLSEEELQNLNVDWENQVENSLSSQGFASVSVFTSKNVLLTCVTNNLSGFTQENLDFQEFNCVVNDTDITIGQLNEVYLRLNEDTRYLPFSEGGLVVSPVSESLANKSKANDWLMDRAEQYIRTYYASAIKAHEVADVINISPNYFSSLFKQKTGKSFNEYINTLRVDAAKQLLEETPFNVNEIAEKVGYREYKYFVDVFKKFTGYTPTKYRNVTANNINQS
ncbi:two-component system response regulator YesN [Neobacillus niacini]|uniref:response regulator transcription factor n=1 Tax=Neobacillus driksii TaxID=3035913 RepID=UPI0027849BF3|nr:response regulator [Neobacillus niacini]MDQ0974980.1 two-component system response regulator YesN [Neobacillus niacini]